MRLSIIIPTLNEESCIQSNLSIFARDIKTHFREIEIIVADGGSVDRTVELVREFTDKVCVTSAGRGKQMNAGAKISEGDYLLFLHADSVLSASGIEGIFNIMADNEIAGGAFRLMVDSDRFSLKIVSYFANIRSEVFNIAYGDQGIFLKRDIFFNIGGYPDIPIMEDVAFVRRLKKAGKFVILPYYIIASPRRWEKEGVFYTTMRNWFFILSYMSGVSPYRLKDWYKNHGG